ncbi:MAG: threonine--tRNA ligase [Candidatus Taylorbacteria bacterium RIFCSPHIGHO2_02_FULL_47_18]|uniref:Threonine--tRNA ligase n=1 Tax=Candidatus Taylorbacteria bacterium RIFCSPLOWO2_01_FULL_48_100 TaxID=1802322 RepID=A0A1G2NE31_9BACT|nr:MAG: threonine--tRNA ligase [Candidatus Taylorbacteria bacterium RIFCSPHIGHO2_01_FULL_48_38]OHA27621.1 MAG: threonine--tRNA ligase [Candidatus Taylorbacteria bacterium RIFCSPHIGHO2_02_FULL_47_18]OHA34313.1 MAG: threonine--tRNA ligase [Candidatus Taylorbacteria bacterium RIFCSPLOWO2_01_FULL_48_100]OHA40467.1 MAG: threonine--tRNA ligase [Candidatus Taylorbacteria bacterium RIFCSPLOWO2_02_FULL_48_16]OHA44893.1 MAG: threonine--tRNA ligase [Candidatus Taylorbacteria bacterium RIFCSPLOWO2_12_FULL_
MKKNDKKPDEDLSARDHRVIGKELGLFSFSDTVGKGLPLWTPKGTVLRRELERFITDEEIRRGYSHVATPDIAKIDLYKKSGHYPYYKESMYAPIDIDGEEFMLRPMACPHHFELYLSEPRSYRDLPMRIAEFANMYRYELSGVLSGLVRVRGFCLSDAHIICANREQAESEVASVLDLIDYFSGIFGLRKSEDYWYRLSLGDRADSKKYYKDDAAWDAAEEVLRSVLQKRKEKFSEMKNEAAFYGPKIDVQMKDIRGLENTAFTVQYDFVMPKRFKLVYTDKDGMEKESVVIHRSSVGALERLIAFLIEKYNGAFPLWLSPVQMKVLPVGEKFLQYAEKVHKELVVNDIRSELDESNETLGKKVRSVKLEKVPYWIVVGEQEEKADSVTLESREGNKQSLSVADAVMLLKKQIAEKK